MTYLKIVELGRRVANSRMGAANGGSTVTIRRDTGEVIPHPVTGEEIPLWEVIHADIPARIGGASSGASSASSKDFGGARVEVANRTLSLPAGTAGLIDGDYADVTAGENAGMALRIIEVDWKDQSTALRMPVQSVQRPGEWP